MSPCGANRTAFTESGCTTPEIVVGAVSAPAGTVSVVEPTVRVPPSGPIVCEAESKGWGEHLSNRLKPQPNQSDRTSGTGCAAGTVGETGVRSQEPRMAEPARRPTIDRKRGFGLIIPSGRTRTSH